MGKRRNKRKNNRIVDIKKAFDTAKEQKAPQQESAPPTCRTTAHTTKRPRLWWFLKTVGIFAIGYVLGGVANVEQIWGPLFPDPEIHPQSAQVDQPFGIALSLHNQSRVFAMKIIDISCAVDKVIAEGNVTFSGSAVHNPVSTSSIEPQSTAQYWCPFSNLIRTNPIKFADIQLTIKFRNVWRTRTIKSDHFLWNQFTKQWSEGTPLN